MQQLSEMEFEELSDASLNERKQALDLACRRHPWFKDSDYLKTLIPISLISTVISVLILYFLNDDIWLVPVVMVSGYFVTVLLAPKQAKRIKPLLKHALCDVRIHKYR